MNDFKEWKMDSKSYLRTYCFSWGQLWFKEHARASSKGSAHSLLFRKPIRPETKVYHSSPNQIARLIEQLSRGADAGSFNIQPSPSAHHSHSSSLQSMDSSSIPWSVEERLDQMLGYMNSSSWCHLSSALFKFSLSCFLNTVYLHTRMFLVLDKY